MAKNSYRHSQLAQCERARNADCGGKSLRRRRHVDRLQNGYVVAASAGAENTGYVGIWPPGMGHIRACRRLLRIDFAVSEKVLVGGGKRGFDSRLFEGTR